MKILVYGAGPLGSYFAAKLHEAGENVSLLARRQRLADLQEHGVVLHEPGGRDTTTRVPLVEQLAPGDAYDLVLVVMGKNAVASVLPALAASSATPSVLFLGNNVAGPEELVRALGSGRVLLGFPGIGGVVEGHAVRVIYPKRGKQGLTLVGELNGSKTPRLEQIVGALHRAGIKAHISSNIDAFLKTHFAFIGPLTDALFGAGGSDQLADSDRIPLMLDAVKEGFRVLHALHIPITPSPFKALEIIPVPVFAALMKRMLKTEHVRSMSRDLTSASHREEVRHLDRDFQDLVRMHGAPTPAMDRLKAFCTHREHPWRIHDLAQDFVLYDIVEFPIAADKDRSETLHKFMWTLANQDLRAQGAQAKAAAVLVYLRQFLARILDWDKGQHTYSIPGCSERGIRDRMSEDDKKRDQPGLFVRLPAPFEPVYTFEDEDLREFSNGHMHVLIHASMVKKESGLYNVQFAWYLKMRARKGAYYMKMISPFREHVIRPAMVKRVQAKWALRSKSEADATEVERHVGQSR